MIRITTEPRGAGYLVRVEGRLQAPDVPLLRQVCTEISGEMEIDLAELRDIDDEGAAVIGALVDEGARLGRASTYIKLRIESVQRSKGSKRKERSNAREEGCG